jgi:predicted AlkP superfamily phosphohydrolase/phosphomutase
MKVFVIGLDCAAPDVLLADPALTTLRYLMATGCHGRLRSVVPPITIPAWMCLSCSQDPGSLGVYGFRNRQNWLYDGFSLINSRSFHAAAIWDRLSRAGRKVVIAGVPPSYPPRVVNGVSVGCFLTPDTSRPYTHPVDIGGEVTRLVGDYPVDVAGFRTNEKDWLRDQVFEMTRRHFAVIRHLMRTQPWDYFQFVEIGLDRIQHGFWQYHDPLHVSYPGPGNPYETVVRDYYRLVDAEVAALLELLDDETTVLVVSDHGAQRLDGGFCINQWLIDRGLLALRSRPAQPTPLSKLDVDWARTAAWGEGGYCGRLFLNVRGREPQGRVAAADYERVRDDIAAALEATSGEDGPPAGTEVFRPERIYRSVRNIAPDLIVHFGGLYWRAIGSVGYPRLRTRENDTGPDGCNHAQYGAFILTAPGIPAIGEMAGASLLDMVPTLADVAGWDVPGEMQGRPLPLRASAAADA